VGGAVNYQALARVLAKHQLGGVLPGGVTCTCGEDLAALNPPLDDGSIKGEPLALAVHQLQQLEPLIGAAVASETTAMWTRPNTSSGLFTALRRRGISFRGASK
jgi:hypothetical protein